MGSRKSDLRGELLRNIERMKSLKPRNHAKFRKRVKINDYNTDGDKKDKCLGKGFGIRWDLTKPHYL